MQGFWFVRSKVAHMCDLPPLPPAHVSHQHCCWYNRSAIKATTAQRWRRGTVTFVFLLPSLSSPLLHEQEQHVRNGELYPSVNGLKQNKLVPDCRRKSIQAQYHEAHGPLSPSSGSSWLWECFSKLTLPASLSGRPESLSEDFQLARLSREWQEVASHRAS